MPGERLSMRKIREVLRLRFAQGLSQRAIGISLRLSTGAVNTYLNRARLAGLRWPLPDGLDDAQLETLLYPPPPAVAAEQRPVPDWAVVHRELRRPNMRLSLLWEEYRDGTGAQDGFGYSWFCDLYREWVGPLKPTLRHVHTAGERVFVDFAGHAMEVIEGRPEKYAGPRSSSPCWVPPATRSPKRPGHSRCRIGLPRMSPRWRSSAVCRGRSSVTTCALSSERCLTGRGRRRRCFAISKFPNRPMHVTGRRRSVASVQRTLRRLPRSRNRPQEHHSIVGRPPLPDSPSVRWL
jgi:hypothetical protein